jgi:trehalose-phosphatase
LSFKSEDELNQRVLEAERLWLFLDYDGTLKEFTRTPDILKPDPELIGLLRRLAQKDKIQLAIITGRRLHDILTLLPVEGIFIAATYGLELLTPEGESILREDYAAIRPYLEQLKPQWQSLISGHKGFFLEDKGWALALHGRFASASEADRILSTAESLVNPDLLHTTYQLTNQNKFLEISSLKANKAETVSFLLNHYLLPRTVVVYLGDDHNDSQAFEVIHSIGGIAIAVAHIFGRVQARGADFVLKSPKAARHWLKTLDGNV